MKAITDHKTIVLVKTIHPGMSVARPTMSPPGEWCCQAYNHRAHLAPTPDKPSSPAYSKLDCGFPFVFLRHVTPLLQW